MERMGDLEGARRLRRAFALFVPTAEKPAGTPSLESALDTGDADAIGRSRVHDRASLATVALRAVRAGQLELADSVARRVLAAEPGNTDALVALLAARDLGASRDDVSPWPGPLPGDRSPPSALAREVMAELLSRRAGRAATRTFSGESP